MKSWSHDPSITMINEGSYVPTVPAQTSPTPRGRVTASPPNAVSTTRHPALVKPAPSAGVRSYMPESPTSITVEGGSSPTSVVGVTTTGGGTWETSTSA